MNVRVNRERARGSDRGRTTLDALRSQIEGNARGPLVEVLAEMMQSRPSKADLKKAAKKNPLGFVKAMRQVAEPLIPKEFHTSHLEVNAADVLAEMRARGLVDRETQTSLARNIGHTVEGEAQEVPGQD